MTSIEQLHVQPFSRIKKNAKFGAILRENTVSFGRFFFFTIKILCSFADFFFLIFEFFGRKMDENCYFSGSFSFCFETCFLEIPRYVLLLCQDFVYIL